MRYHLYIIRKGSVSNVLMIRSFKCEYTEGLSKGHKVKKFVNIAKVDALVKSLNIFSSLLITCAVPGTHKTLNVAGFRVAAPSTLDSR